MSSTSQMQRVAMKYCELWIPHIVQNDLAGYKHLLPEKSGATDSATIVKE